MAALEVRARVRLPRGDARTAGVRMGRFDVRGVSAEPAWMTMARHANRIPEGVKAAFRLRECFEKMHAPVLENGFEARKIQIRCVFFKKIAKNYVQVLVFCTNCFFFVLIFVS